MKLLASLLLLSFAAWPQVAVEANKGYQTKEGRENVARGLDNPNRDKAQKPEEIIAAMHIPRGSTVADIGTGTGYMLPHLSRAVGPDGKVFGEDIQTDFLGKARARASADHLANTEFVLGAATDPKLPAASIDTALVLDVYHHFDYPAKMLANIASALKPDGHLVIVEYYKAHMPGHIRLDRDEVLKQIESNGFKLVSKVDAIGASQYMLTFARPR